MTLRDKFALTKSSLKVKFDCSHIAWSFLKSHWHLGTTVIQKLDVHIKFWSSLQLDSTGPYRVITIPVTVFYLSIPLYSIRHLSFIIITLISWIIPEYGTWHHSFMIITLTSWIIPEYSIQHFIFTLALFTLYLSRYWLLVYLSVVLELYIRVR